MGPPGSQGQPGAPTDWALVNVNVDDSTGAATATAMATTAPNVWDLDFDFHFPKPNNNVTFSTTSGPTSSCALTLTSPNGAYPLGAYTYNWAFTLGAGPTGPQGPAGMPIGSIVMWSVAAAPTGWLICNGQAITNAQYSLLCTALGSPGADTTVPDMRDLSPIGAASSNGGTVNAVNTNSAWSSIAVGSTYGGPNGTGNNFGTYQLLNSDLAAHTHTVTDPGHVHLTTEAPHTHAIGNINHEHTFTDFYNGNGGVAASDGGNGNKNPVTRVANTDSVVWANGTGPTNSSVSTNLTIQTATTGIVVNSGPSVSVAAQTKVPMRPPVYGVHFIIKALNDTGTPASRAGTATILSGQTSVVVPTVNINFGSIVLLTPKTGISVSLTYGSIVQNTSFTIQIGSALSPAAALDVNWAIIGP
jgi:microcystin-dependent protein